MEWATPQGHSSAGASVALPCPEVQLLTLVLCSKQGDAEAPLWLILHPSFPLLLPHSQDLGQAGFPPFLLFQAIFKMLSQFILSSPRELHF